MLKLGDRESAGLPLTPVEVRGRPHAWPKMPKSVDDPIVVAGAMWPDQLGETLTGCFSLAAMQRVYDSVFRQGAVMICWYVAPRTQCYDASVRYQNRRVRA